MTATGKTIKFKWDSWIGLAELHEALEEVRDLAAEMHPSPVIISMDLLSYGNGESSPARSEFTIEMGRLAQ